MKSDNPFRKYLPQATSDQYKDAKHANNLERGSEFQDFVQDMIALHLGINLQFYTSKRYQYDVGESRQGWEIKLDALCTDTKRLSIETAEKVRASDNVWTPSGIYRTDNTWMYVQGNYDILFLFPKAFLKQLHVVKDGHEWRYQRKEEPTIQAFYLPIEDAMRYAARVLDFRE